MHLTTCTRCMHSISFQPRQFRLFTGLRRDRNLGEGGNPLPQQMRARVPSLLLLQNQNCRLLTTHTFARKVHPMRHQLVQQLLK
ncbi:hypothetical protein DPMN_012025 [Dreissena polymorpha]|uniref:Uncharacterized protein n=1 Tax=Dreissena polymorpha TaxID=45954 RepID=A0A9D4N687_DREPO|nr:hypothetical protein DPMN_012025 [Dreissena polymorpha]